MSKTNKIKRKNYQKEINDVLNEYLETRTKEEIFEDFRKANSKAMMSQPLPWENLPEGHYW